MVFSHLILLPVPSPPCPPMLWAAPLTWLIFFLLLHLAAEVRVLYPIPMSRVVGGGGNFPTHLSNSPITWVSYNST